LGEVFVRFIVLTNFNFVD